MFEQLDSLDREGWFVILAFALSVLLSFLFGYMLFRYAQIDLCKPPMEILSDQN